MEICSHACIRDYFLRGHFNINRCLPTYLAGQSMSLSFAYDRCNILFRRNPFLSPNYTARVNPHFYSCSWASLASRCREEEN